MTVTLNVPSLVAVIGVTNPPSPYEAPYLLHVTSRDGLPSGKLSEPNFFQLLESSVAAFTASP